VTPAPANIFQQLADPTTAGSSTTPQAAPATTGNIFQQLAEGSYKDPNTPPPTSAEDDASNTRQMLVSGLTGMPTPNMTEQDKAQFEQGRAAGAVSVPAVAGAYLAAHSALAAGGPALVKALTTGAVGLGEWAREHPIAAKIIYHGIGAAIKGTMIGVGAKVAGKVIDSATP
jgi:hypothetical protein